MESQFSPGDHVTWRREWHDGGAESIPAEVVRLTLARVVIRFELQSGKMAERMVKPEQLRRSKPASEAGKRTT